MPRRSFVLLVLVMLAGLWTPPQATKAQTGCPAGGCKVFLPLVLNNSVAEGVVETISPGPRCGGTKDLVAYVIFTLTNVSTAAISNLQVEGVAIAENGVMQPFSGMTHDVMFPGETNRYVFPVTEGMDCPDGAVTGVIRVLGYSAEPQARSITVVSRSLVEIYACNQQVTYQVSGTVRNDGSLPLKNIRVFLLYSIATQYVNTGIEILAPGETADFSQEIFGPTSFGECYPIYGVYPQDAYKIHAWGDITH